MDIIEREGARKRSAVLFNQVQTGTVLSRELDGMAKGSASAPSRTACGAGRRTGAQSCSVGSPCRSVREEMFKVALEIIALAK